MAKRCKKHSKSTSVGGGFSKGNMKNFMLTGATLVAGMAVGSAINKFVAKKDAVSGTDLLGLDGQTSKWTTPLITVGAGLLVSGLSKNVHVRNIAMGIGAAGAVNLVNTVMGETKISLSGDAEEATIMLPGISGGNEVVTYDELPSENELATQYSEPVLAPVGDVDSDVDFEAVDGLGVTMEFEDYEINGVELL